MARGWTSERSLPILNFVKYPPGISMWFSLRVYLVFSFSPFCLAVLDCSQPSILSLRFSCQGPAG